MIRIAVVEDDESYVKQLREYLVRFGQEKNVVFRVEVFSDGKQILFDYQPVYDIILMDIEMPDVDGITAAKRIREQDREVILIFITNMAQYAIQGYTVRARSYILKPVNYYSFAFELEEAVGTLSQKTGDSLLLPGEDGLQKVMIGEIYYLESQRHKIIVHTARGVIKVRETLKNMEERLQKYYFERCNVSFLINLAHVTGILGDMVLVGQERVPISRQKRKPFLAALSDYMGGSAHD